MTDDVFHTRYAAALHSYLVAGEEASLAVGHTADAQTCLGQAQEIFQRIGAASSRPASGIPSGAMTELPPRA